MTPTCFLRPLSPSSEPTAARAHVCGRGARSVARWLRPCSVSGGCGSAPRSDPMNKARVTGVAVLLLVCGGLERAPAQGRVQTAAAVNQETNKPGEQMAARLDPDFVQGQIRITPPVTREKDRRGEPIFSIYNDGGTRRIPIRDAKGRRFDVFIDHRIGHSDPSYEIGLSKSNSVRVVHPPKSMRTDGHIYPNAYPGETNSVRVIHPDEFKRKVGDFEK